MKKVGVILIRSGSKGLPDKNIRLLAGKPLCFWTIDCALASNAFDEIWISSDSSVYLQLCETEYGSNCRYLLRDAALAQDETTTFETLEGLFQSCDDDFIFAHLQVTSPIRKVEHIQEALGLYENAKARHVVSFCEPKESRSLFMNTWANGFLKPSRHGGDYRRQDEERFIYPDGAIWISSKTVYLEDKTFYTNRTMPYMLPKEYSYDIDDEVDFAIAERLLEYVKK